MYWSTSSLILIVCFCVCSVMSNSLWPHPRLLCPWDFPHKSTGEVWQLSLLGDLPHPGAKPVFPVVLSWADRFYHWAWVTWDTLYWLYSGCKMCYPQLPALIHASCVFMKLCIEKNWATQWEIVLSDPCSVLSMARLVCVTIHVLILTNSGLQQPQHGLLKP